MARTERRAVRLLSLAVLLLLALALIEPMARAAVSAPSVGFGAVATAEGSSITYSDPSLPVPASPAVEVDGAYSTAAMQSGPIGRALASAAWPGDFVAGVGPALGLVLPVNPGIGAYPVRAQASYPQGQSEAVDNSVPGSAMSASAHGTGVGASASTGALQSAAGLVDGLVRSEVHEQVGADGVHVTGSAGATGVSILAGLVTVGSVTSTAAVSSAGAAPQGRTAVAGLTVAGVPMAVDAGGVSVAGSGTGQEKATAAAEDVLRHTGVTVFLARPVDITRKGYSERDAGGLVIGVDGKALASFLASTGPAGATVQQLLAPQQGLWVSLGAVDVSVGTVPGAGGGSVLSPLGGGTSGGGGSGGSAPVPPTPSGAADQAGATSGGLPAPAGTGVGGSALPSVAGPAGSGTGAASRPNAASPLVGTIALAPAAYKGILPWQVLLAVLGAAAAAAVVWRLTGALLAAAGDAECLIDGGGRP